MTSPTTGTFHYRLLDKKGKDITSELPVSDLFVDARISTDGWNNGGERAAASLDPQTGTCTLTYDFSESDKYIKIYIMPRYSSADSKTLVIGNSDAEDLKRVDEIHFLCRNLDYSGSLNDLKSLKELTHLKLLDLGSTKISSQDLSSLQKALPDCFIMP